MAGLVVPAIHALLGANATIGNVSCPKKIPPSGLSHAKGAKAVAMEP
jgi:hypothetical protein